MTTLSENSGIEARTAMERSGLYGFLATIFRSEPTEAQIKGMKSPSFQEALGGIDLGFTEANETVLARDLAVEYAALFLGPGGHVSPHESVHVDDGGQLLSEATLAVKNYIEACGFEYDPDYHELPDHISTEFEFLAEVTRQEAVAWQENELAKALNCLEYEREFFDRHLGRWVPAFCERVLERAELPFYRRIIELARNFLDDEVGEINRRLTLAKSAKDGSLQAFASEGHC
jgi:putative dimethyl sulfoxide reductase chaperone